MRGREKRKSKKLYEVAYTLALLLVNLEKLW